MSLPGPAEDLQAERGARHLADDVVAAAAEDALDARDVVALAGLAVVARCRGRSVATTGLDGARRS